MVVLLHPVALLVLRALVAKLVTSHQVAIQKQVKGVVQRRSGHAVRTFAHHLVQGVHIEVAVVAVNLVQDGEPLRGFPVAVLLEVGFKKPFHLLENRVLCHAAAKIGHVIQAEGPVGKFPTAQNAALPLLETPASLHLAAPA